MTGPSLVDYLISKINAAEFILTVNDIVDEKKNPTFARLSSAQQARVRDAAQKRRGLLAQAPGPM